MNTKSTRTNHVYMSDKKHFRNGKLPEKFVARKTK